MRKLSARRQATRVDSHDLTFSSQTMESLLLDAVNEPDGWPAWRTRVYQQLTTRMRDSGFPCMFSRRSFEKASQTFCFVESTEEHELLRLCAGIVEYLDASQRVGPPGNLTMPLLVFFRPPEQRQTLRAHHAQAWSILQFLHDNDQRPWPPEIPTDSDHYLWSFCFHGVQLFVNFSSPEHRVVRSRNLGDALAFVINPRQNFDTVAGYNAEGQAVRDVIRGRIEGFEGHPHSTELGTYGDPENREWWQYQMGEPSSPRPKKCPLQIRHP